MVENTNHKSYLDIAQHVFANITEVKVKRSPLREMVLSNPAFQVLSDTMFNEAYERISSISNPAGARPFAEQLADINQDDVLYGGRLVFRYAYTTSSFRQRDMEQLLVLLTALFMSDILAAFWSLYVGTCMFASSAQADENLWSRNHRQAVLMSIIKWREDYIAQKIGDNPIYTILHDLEQVCNARLAERGLHFTERDCETEQEEQEREQKEFLQYRLQRRREMTASQPAENPENKTTQPANNITQRRALTAMPPFLLRAGDGVIGSCTQQEMRETMLTLQRIAGLRPQKLVAELMQLIHDRRLRRQDIDGNIAAFVKQFNQYITKPAGLDPLIENSFRHAWDKVK